MCPHRLWFSCLSVDLHTVVSLIFRRKSCSSGKSQKGPVLISGVEKGMFRISARPCGILPLYRLSLRDG